jgi:hypothetical protein
VPTKLLPPRKYRRIRHTTPSRGKVEIHVEASSPVNIYVVKAENIDTYRDSSVFKYRDRTELSRKLELPFLPGEDWYLVIRNKSDEPAAIHYEVYY